ncbi:MAG TPA: winged helix-turn-helix domain-containing protein [Blastocatellia bacterium]|nr:winged helix-turn-helix domain-containing protein [Blastocatellia bacterium]HMV85665.1 winged helix-turn-helix domain-containing protein [Blastocatellia bacterium]HMZ17835.1 winged helix-turn-helix domain-containing protein [Blastocatellia bacterium]HNG29695.1 winged helix-turn-helix domain-containing protein [Blastocatellia bacterium]
MRDNKHVPLTPKAYEILLVLIESRDRIVSKDELMEKVWPDTTVEESNIAKNISLLRRTLANGKEESGEEKPDQENSKYIVTIPKRGYRFIREVQEVAATSSDVVPIPVTPEIAPPPTLQAAPPIKKIELPLPATPIPDTPVLSRTRLRVSRRVYFTILLVASLSIAGLIAVITSAFVSRREPKNIDPAKIKHNVVASWKMELGANLLTGRTSPNGKFIAYSRSQAGQADIYIGQLADYVGQLADVQPMAITQDEWPDYSPIWSPDGQKVAYLSARPNGNELWVSPLLGKGKKLHQVGTDYVRLLHWSKTGEEIFYETTRDLFSLNLKSGQSVQLTHFEGTTQMQGGFSISPDEKSIVYIASVDKSSRIFVAPISGNPTKQLTNEGEQNISPVWFADGKRILYASKRGDSFQLCIAYLDGRPPIQVMSNPDSAKPIHIAPDGKTIFYQVLKEEADIYQVETESGNEAQIASEALLEIFPEVSPDGKAILLQQTSTADTVFSGNILTQNLSPKSLAQRRIEGGFDARWLGLDRLVFLREAGGVSSLWIARNDGADQRQLTQETVLSNGLSTQPYGWAQPYNYSWSPTENLLAYSAAKAKVLNIWTVSANGGRETMISNNADPTLKLVCPIWSPDGKRLAYLAQSSAIAKVPRSIMLYERTSESGKEQTLFQTESRIRMAGWSADGVNFLFGETPSDKTAATVDLDLKQIAPGQKDAVPVGQLKEVYFNSLRLSPDGKSVAYISRRNNCDNIWQISLKDRQPKKVTNNRDPLLHFATLAWSPDRKSIYFSTQSATTLIRSIENFD